MLRCHNLQSTENSDTPKLRSGCLHFKTTHVLFMHMLDQTTDEIQEQYLVSQQVSSDRLFVYRCPGHFDCSAVY